MRDGEKGKLQRCVARCGVFIEVSEECGTSNGRPIDRSAVVNLPLCGRRRLNFEVTGRF